MTGFFGQSGTALLPILSADYSHTNFSFVASNLGCDYSNDPAKELSCMRQVSWEDIEAFVGGYSDNGTMPALGFNPIPDDVVVFSNVSQRYAENKVSQRPAIFSTTKEEGNALVPYKRSGIDEKAAEQVTVNYFVCPAAETSTLRTQAGLKTYRYQYSGNFSNVSPLPWMGPYHASDLPMLFGTHQDYTNGQGHSTEFEFAVSEKMEDFLLAFMTNPDSGPESIGWPAFDSGSMVEFGADGEVVQQIRVQSVDGVCNGG